MIKVTVTGWNHGLNKVQLNRLLRQHTGCELAEAKRAVDQLLAGEVLTYQFPDPESASVFCRSASAIGAICITEEHGTGSDPARLEGDIVKCGVTVGKPG
jgi:hypothetical protein